ncbi:MAG: archease [bacterium]|nr:archease [bacterium]
MAENKCYEYIDHTADIGIRGYGKTFLEALLNVAQGMIAAMHPLDQVESIEPRELDITAVTQEDLVVQFLNHLLYLHDAEGFIPKEYQIELMGENRIQGTLHGELFNPVQHTIYDEIKAATYHQLQVNQTDTGWVIQVICDL